jgi:aminoglycoside phosphotransferase (APT) family kinase protein
MTTGQPQWHFDVESPEYAASLGSVLAELHTVDPAVVRDSGIPEFSPAEIRQRKREDIERRRRRVRGGAELCSGGGQRGSTTTAIGRRSQP